jgi:hypothetical protein
VRGRRELEQQEERGRDRTGTPSWPPTASSTASAIVAADAAA